MQGSLLRALLCLSLLVPAAMHTRADAADSPFAPPPEFAPDIHFWTRIYTEVGTDGGLLHDERYLNVVYDVMKFPADLSPRERARRVAAAKERYSAILRKLSGMDAPADEESKRVRALWPQNTSRLALREAAERIRFQLGQANRFRQGLIRAGAYEAHIAETLTNMGLPPELSALPHVESSFDPSARSHAGAAGLWQFIRSTGRRYMRIDADVDERMDPYLSTVAAARFLKFNYDLLGSWPLALTAYNHGPAGMRRAKEQLGTDDIVRISRTYQSRTFGFASRNYYIAFLAALQVDQDPEKYFGALQRHPEIKTRGVVLQAYVPVTALERTFGIDAQMLRILNPSLTSAVWRGERRVPRGFELRLPEGLEIDPAIRLASLDPGQRFDQQKPEVLHRVRKGETLSSIASASKVSIDSLLQANGLRDSRRLRAGQVLRIPQAGEEKVELAQVEAAAAEKEAKVKAKAAAKAKTEADAKAKAKASEQAAAMAAKKAQEAAAAKAAAAVAAQAPPPAPPEAEPPVTEVEVAENDREIARAENAEPVSETEAEEIGPQLVASEQSPLVADPSDYSIAEDLTIEIQAAETLGHIAEWLDLRASRLRELNKLRYGQPVVTGRRLTIELTQVSVEEFERRRRAYHQGLQEAFFAANRIVGTEVHIVRRGESLWSIAQNNPAVPIWLLRQHNPDVDFAEVRPKTPIVLPVIEAVPASASATTVKP